MVFFPGDFRQSEAAVGTNVEHKGVDVKVFSASTTCKEQGESTRYITTIIRVSCPAKSVFIVLYLLRRGIRVQASAMVTHMFARKTQEKVLVSSL